MFASIIPLLVLYYISTMRKLCLESMLPTSGRYASNGWKECF